MQQLLPVKKQFKGDVHVFMWLRLKDVLHMEDPRYTIRSMTTQLRVSGKYKYSRKFLEGDLPKVANPYNGNSTAVSCCVAIISYMLSGPTIARVFVCVT